MGAILTSRGALAVIFGLIALFSVLWLVAQRLHPATYSLRITAGDTLGRRYQLASLLAQEGKRHNLEITITETSGSQEALKAVAVGKLDMALIQGGQDIVPNVEQVAALSVEPLHLLVKKEIARRGIFGLRGKRVNLSTRQSGTRHLALKVLSFLGMQPGRDFEDEDRPYAQLEALSYEGLPDAVFLVSTMPSPVAEFLIRHHGFRIVPLPYGDALGLRDIAIVPTTIPPFTYGAVPPVPEATVPTVGNRLLLVASARLSPAAVREVLTLVRDASFLHRANLPEVPEDGLVHSPEMSVHPGTTDFLERNRPAFTSDDMQGLDSFRNMAVSVLVGIFFIWRWFRRRRYRGFEMYMQEVTAIERVALEQERRAAPDLRELLTIRSRLSAIKTEALEKFGTGQLRGEELLSGFLTHVADVRAYVTALMLSERGRLADLSADSLPDSEQMARFERDWKMATQTTLSFPDANEKSGVEAGGGSSEAGEGAAADMGVSPAPIS